jgi:exodeoxyribonuclease VIII
MSDTAVAVTAQSTLELLSEEMGFMPSWGFQQPEFVGTDYKNQIIMGFNEASYHQDLTAVARGDVLKFLTSPQHMAARRREAYQATSESDALRFGSAVHMLLLEPAKFKERFVLQPEFGDGRTKAAKDAKAAWLATCPEGSLALKADEMRNIFGITQSLARNRTALALFEGALCESTAYYRDPVTGLKCRVRPDIVNRQLSALVDLKTTMSADFSDFQRSMWNFRYDLQLAMYAAGIEAATGERPETLAIIAVEKEDPWSCVVFTLDEVARDRGTTDYRRGLDGIAKCVETNEWPGLPEESAPLSLPRWVLAT